MEKKIKKPKAEYYRIGQAMVKDSVRISVPRAFLSTLTLFFHHVSDAMGGDDRPDHGLAKMRQGREYYRGPFHLLYGKLKRAEEKMGATHYHKALQLFHQYHECLNKREKSLKNKKSIPSEA